MSEKCFYALKGLNKDVMFGTDLLNSLCGISSYYKGLHEGTV